MRCQTCADRAHPGYLDWRAVAAGGQPIIGLAPCPDCGGSTIVGCCEGRAWDLPDRGRIYRCYLLDERGMIVLAELVEADADDAACADARLLLEAAPTAVAVEVSEGGRRVALVSRAETAAYTLPDMVAPGDPARSR
jgi:hypothetical protein